MYVYVGMHACRNIDSIPKAMVDMSSVNLVMDLLPVCMYMYMYVFFNVYVCIL